MKNRFLFKLTTLLAVLALLIGCITTATFVTTAVLVTGSSPLDLADEDYSGGELEADLTDDEDFKDNRNKIKNIDNIGFYAKITNNTLDPVIFQLFLEEDISKNWDQMESPAQVVVDSTTALILTGLTIPGSGTVTMNWNESMNYITGLGYIKDIIETGSFAIYPIARRGPDFDVDFDITIDSLVVIVTFTGG